MLLSEINDNDRLIDWASRRK